MEDRTFLSYEGKFLPPYKVSHRVISRDSVQSYNLTTLDVPVAQSVHRPGYQLTNNTNPGKGKIFFFEIVHSAVGPAKPPIQSVPGGGG